MIKEYEDKYYNNVNVLGREISDDYFLRLSPVSKCFVYEEDDEIVGFILADIFSDRAEIIDISVSLLYRNKGIGNKLLNYVLGLSKNNGCESVSLEVKSNNKSAINLYHKNGFKTVSIRKKYYNKGTIDANLMLKKL